MVKIPTGLNNLKTKINDLDVVKLKIIPIDLEKMSNLVDKKVVKKAVYDTLNTKVYNLEEKISGGSTLIWTNQYNIDQQSLEKNVDDAEKKFLVLLV